MRSLAAHLVFAAAFLSGCTPLGVLNSLLPTDTYVATRDIAYGSDARHRVDVYRPAGAAPPGGFPVVVFFYGGFWSSGERADYRFMGEALASKGIVAAVADYRLHPPARYPAFLEDCALAVAWMRREARRFDGDPAKLFLMGHSAGGYNAAMLALDPRWLGAHGLSPAQLAGWIGLAGVYDFLPSRRADVQPIFHHPDYPKGAQPVEHVSRNAPRALLVAPVSDATVDPVRNTRGLADRLLAAGAPVTVKTYDGVGHATLVGAFGWPLRGFAPVLEDAVLFVGAR